jgi:serine/threonine protein kinase
MQQVIISNKYKLIEKIGSGAFGDIYKGENIRTKESVAIKVEPLSNETKLLKNETKIYQYLGNTQGIPQVKWFGVDEHNNYMAMKLLGSSLTDNIKKVGPLSLKNAKYFTTQILKIVKKIHDKELLHRDIKPDNFLFGIQDDINIIHIIDFGFCKRYLDNERKHIPHRVDKTPLGTPNYISVNVHDGVEPSRRDDLESVGYVALYMLYGKLPWDDLNDYIQDYKNVNNHMKIKKTNLLKDEQIPSEVTTYLSYCRNLTFEETPNYEYLLALLE